MGSDDDVVHLPEGMVAGKRFRIGDVQAGGPDLARSQGLHKRRGLNHLSPGDVHHVNVIFHGGELGGSQHPFRGGRMGDAAHHHVGLRQDPVQLVRNHHFLHVPAQRDVLGVDAQDPHAEGGGALGHLGADAAQADDQHGLVTELDHGQPGLPAHPVSAVHLPVVLFQVPG